MACFAVWTLFSIIGIQIQKELGLNDTEFGLLVGTPILTGAMSRLFIGILADRFGGRKVMAVVDADRGARRASCCPMRTTYAAVPRSRRLVMGVAGGSFAAGVAYVARWFPKERTGTALGIFGMGTFGAAITNFSLVPDGRARLDGGRAHLGRRARRRRSRLLSCSPRTIRRRASAEWRGAPSLAAPARAACQAPGVALRHLLCLRLRRLRRARAVAAALLYRRLRAVGRAWRACSRPPSRCREACSAPSAAGCPTGSARARSCTGPSASSIVATFLLSYPTTHYVVQGIKGPIEFTLAMGIVPFAMLTFVLGMFMSFGMAAVYKHIPVYYPDNVGSVGGLVGMIGGLGGFALPIAFGAMADLTGVWTSCFMLLFALVSGAMLWMHLAIRRMERRNAARAARPSAAAGDGRARRTDCSARAPRPPVQATRPVAQACPALVPPHS